jgi:uncharacterized RDD family membrane protein YckC
MTQDNRYEPPKAAVADVGASREDELASRGARFGAALIDGLLAAAIVYPLMFATGVFQTAMTTGALGLEAQLGFGVLGLLLYLVFHGYLLHSGGQTIGKRLVGTRIVSAEDNRILPLWKIFTLRFLPISVVSQIPGIGPILILVDSVFVFRGDKRCVHDLVAGTKVINASAPWKGLTDLNDAN